MIKKSCFQCGAKEENKNLHGYPVCQTCKSKLKLFTDEKIGEFITEYKKNKKHSLEAEMKQRLDILEKDYIRKKIKLLHVLARIKKIKK